MAEPVPPPRRTHAGEIIHISSFRERGMTGVGAREQPFRIRIGAVKNIDFMVPDDNCDSGQLGQIFRTILEYARASQDNIQMVAFIASAMNLIMPMTNDFTAFLADINCAVTQVKLPSGLEGGDYLLEDMTWWEIMTYFLQMVLLLYKNIGEENYLSYMTNRVVAARAFLSAPELLETDIVLPLASAKVVKRILGGSHKIRQTVLTKLLSARTQNNNFGQMCSYICGILTWTEMSYMNFIFEEIVLTNSPILEATSVASEIQNLTQALAAILATPYPQYYKIMTPVSQQRYTERNRFPLLIAAAISLKKDKVKSVRFFVQGAIADDPAVANLVALHMRAQEVPSRMMNRATDFLKGDIGIAGGIEGLNYWEA